MRDSGELFSTKVDAYAQYRPSYPEDLIRYLRDSVGIGKASTVADIGAGTGRLTRLLAPVAGRVIAVEPNAPMRSAGIRYCADTGDVVFTDGRAEATGLGDGSVDFITVAQAFHWFDKDKTKAEFKRILKQAGSVILVWNKRDPACAMFDEIYDVCRKYCPDFRGFSGGEQSEDGNVAGFYKNRKCEHRVFQNDRIEPLEAFIGGSLSASYAPEPGTPNYTGFTESLTEIFFRYAAGGLLCVPNQTHSYVGRLD